MNSVMLKGNLGNAPEVKSVGAQGKTVATFSIAVNEYKGKDDNGQSKYATFWVRVVCWGWLADKVSSLQKGDSVVVNGRLSIRSWEDKDGQKRTATEVVADDVHKLQKSPRAIGGGDEPLFDGGGDGFGEPGDVPF